MLEKQSKLSIGNANAKSPCQKQKYERIYIKNDMNG